MAETQVKRQREEESNQIEEGAEFKRQKSYTDILSLLESEEEEPNQDLSSIITTLQQELSSDSSGFDPVCLPDPENFAQTSSMEDYTSSSSCSSSSLKEDEREDKESVMRHLLEASDDELGIPNRDVVGFEGEDGFHGGNGFSLAEGLWEIEDEAANYYTLLQSELFI
ncbi:hypothetical protein UlMin_045238 [Ulmus minor]